MSPDVGYPGSVQAWVWTFKRTCWRPGRTQTFSDHDFSRVPFSDCQSAGRPSSSRDLNSPDGLLFFSSSLTLLSGWGGETFYRLRYFFDACFLCNGVAVHFHRESSLINVKFFKKFSNTMPSSNFNHPSYELTIASKRRNSPHTSSTSYKTINQASSRR